MLKNLLKPFNYSPNFSTGPTKKYTGYDLSKLQQNLLGRSHRSLLANDALEKIIKHLQNLLHIPKDYGIILTPASDSGAFELALWNLLGVKPIDCLCWDYFGDKWLNDIKNQLRISNVNIFQANNGAFPNISNVNFAKNDVVFTACGTTSGVVFNNWDDIAEHREGLIICDATSYIFSENIPWNKIDALTFSWQKALGGEAQNGILVLSPRAMERINSYNPNWAIPSIFNIKKDGKINQDLLNNGSPINTISMLCVADFLNILEYFTKQGGADYIHNKINQNFNIILAWLDKSKNFKFLAKDINHTSKMSICLDIINPYYVALDDTAKQNFLKTMHQYLHDKKIAYDIASHRFAPLGIRIWCGATIDAKHLEYLIYKIEAYFDTNCSL
jgi:phosphoserine aminotransferase